MAPMKRPAAAPVSSKKCLQQAKNTSSEKVTQRKQNPLTKPSGSVSKVRHQPLKESKKKPASNASNIKQRLVDLVATEEEEEDKGENLKFFLKREDAIRSTFEEKERKSFEEQERLRERILQAQQRDAEEKERLQRRLLEAQQREERRIEELNQKHESEKEQLRHRLLEETGKRCQVEGELKMLTNVYSHHLQGDQEMLMLPDARSPDAPENTSAKLKQTPRQADTPSRRRYGRQARTLEPPPDGKDVAPAKGVPKSPAASTDAIALAEALEVDQKMPCGNEVASRAASAPRPGDAKPRPLGPAGSMWGLRPIPYAMGEKSKPGRTEA